MEKTTPTDEQARKLATLLYIRMGAHTAGNIGGLILAYKQKKKFWGYVGYFILGGIVVGGTAWVVTLPAERSIMFPKGKSDTKKAMTQSMTQSDADDLMKEYKGGRGATKEQQESNKKIEKTLNNAGFTITTGTHSEHYKAVKK